MRITILLLLLLSTAAAASISSIPIEHNISEFAYEDTLEISDSDFERRVVTYTKEDNIYRVTIMDYKSYETLMTTLLAIINNPYNIETYKGKEILVHHTQGGDIIKWSDKNYIIDIDRGNFIELKNLTDAYMRKIGNDIPELLNLRCQTDNDCDDENPGTEDICEDQFCMNIQIIHCINNDGYCPATCNHMQDTDCNECEANADCKERDSFTTVRCRGSPKRCVAEPRCGIADGLCHPECEKKLDPDCSKQSEEIPEVTINPTEISEITNIAAL